MLFDVVRGIVIPDEDYDWKTKNIDQGSHDNFS